MPLLFPGCMKNLGDANSIEELFVVFFDHRFMEGYLLELDHPEYTSKLGSGKNKVKIKYKRVKKVVKVMLFCESYVFCDEDSIR